MQPITFVTSLLLAVSIFAQTRVIQHSDKTIRLEFRLPEITRDQIDVEGKTYTRLSYSNNHYLIEQGAPLIPYTIEHIAIPPDAKTSMQFQINEQEEIRRVDILPAALVSGGAGTIVLPLNEDIYNSTAAYPGAVVELGEPYIYRNMQVVDLKIYPLQFFPAERRAQIFKRISVQIEIIEGGTIRGRGVFSKTEKDFLQNHLLNFEEAQEWAVPRSSRLQKTTVTYDFSSGVWYKIPVTQEGIYRITGSFLSSQGIDISNVNIGQIQMFNYGGAPLPRKNTDPVPADLNEIAIEVRDDNKNGIFDQNDVIYFYGRGVDGWRIDPNSAGSHPWESYHHPYATRNYYILTFNQNFGKRIPKENSIQQSNPVVPTAFTDHYRFEEDRFSLLQSGIDWYWIKLRGLNDQASIDFNLPQNLARGKMKIKIQVASKLFYTDPGGFTSSLDVSINGQKIKENITVNPNHLQDYVVTETIEYDDIFAIRGGSNELTIQHRGSKDNAISSLDYFEIYFQRPLQAENNYIKMNYLLDASPTEFRVSNLAASGNRVWDVSDFANVREIIPLQNSSTVIYQDQAPAQTAKEYFVFSNSVVKTVQQLEPIENTPNLRDPSRKGTLLIILPDEFYDAAEGLETFKETLLPNPIETERVRLSEIYREFSSGVLDPAAIRNFLKYAESHWNNSGSQGSVEYVLLVGDGSYDYRGIELKNYVNRLPTFQINGKNDIESRESDHYYVALNNDSFKPELAIGRIPANSGGEIETFIEKLATYEKSYFLNPGDNGWQNTLTFVADDEITPSTTSEWFHLTDTKALIRNHVPEKFDLKKIFLTEFPIQPGGFARIKPLATEAFLNQINRGTLMINFFGHGNPDTWAHEQVFTRSRDLNKINNEGKLSLWVAATCSWGQYDNPSRNSMAEEMIWLKDRGGIAVIAASRAVYATSNSALVNRVYENLFNNKSNDQTSKILGYGLLGALQSSQNDQKFRLFGDPSMKLADAEHKIEITSITPDTLKALSTVEVSAEIKDRHDNPLTDFQGEAIIRVFDTKDTINYVEINTPKYFAKQEKGIFKGLVSVENGKLTGQFIVPKSIKYDKSPNGRISILAWSENSGTAVGYDNTLLINGTESLTDNKGPVVEVHFEGQEDFFDGDFVSTQPTLIVRLSDESGINLTQEVGHRIELTIDDRVKKDVTEFFVYDKDSYQSGQLRYTLPALSPGNHTVKISAWDNSNNLTEREVNFRTIQVQELALEEVVNYPNPFNEDTHFTFQFQSPAGFAEVTIKIYTVSGRLIQEIETIARPGFNKVYWDGRDRDGDRLANGVYPYKIIVDDGQRKMEKIEKLAVLR